MIKFEDEDEKSEEIQATIHDEFEIAERIWRFWAMHQRNPFYRRSNLPHPAKELTIRLEVQAIKQFKSVIDECRKGQAFCANIACRPLFETALALLFLHRSRLAIRLDPILDKHQQHKKTIDGVLRYSAKLPTAKHPPQTQDYLSNEFRANLYWAHAAFDDERVVKKWKDVPGLKRAAQRIKKLLDKPDLAQVVQSYEHTLGPEWTYVIRESNSYCGLKIVQLARLLSLHLYRWYVSVYHYQSRMVHGVDALGHVTADDDGSKVRIYSTNDELRGVLEAAIGQFLICAYTVQDAVPFTNGTKTVLDSLKDESFEVFERTMT